MAEEIIFKTSVDTGTTAKDLQAIDKELNNIDKSAKSTSTDINKTFDDLNKRVESGTLSMRESTQAIKQYQTIALQAGRESPIGKEALQRAGDLKDKLGDLKTEINNLGTDGARMKAALQLGSTVTAGYGALTGVQALLGQENENLTKSMVKLQAVQAVLASLEEIRSALEKESFLMQKAKVAQTWLLTTATAAYSTVVGTSTGAMKVFKLALASTGIGLFIVALGTVVANFDKLKSKTQEVSAKFQDAYKSFANKYPEASKAIRLALEYAFFPITITIKSIQSLYDWLTGTTEASRKAAAVAESNHQKHMKQLDDEQKARDENLKGLDRKIALLEAEGKSTIRLREEKIKLQKQEAEANLAFAEYMKGRMQGNDIFEQSFADMVSAAKDSLNSIEVAEANLNKEKKTLAKERNDDAKAEYDKALQLQYEKNAQELEAYKQFLEQQRGIQEAEDAWKLNQELLADEAQTAKDEKARADEEEMSAWRIKNWEWQASEDLRIEKQKEEDKKKIRDLNRQAVTDSLTTLSNLAQLFAGKDRESQKRAFNIQKAVSVAQATIDTYKAANAALASGSVINPIYGFASAAAVITGGLLNVKKILSQKFEGGGDTSNTSVQPPSTTVNQPQPQLANADTTLTSSIGNSKSNLGKVFVVDSEITAKQNQTANTLSIATVG